MKTQKAVFIFAVIISVAKMSKVKAADCTWIVDTGTNKYMCVTEDGTRLDQEMDRIAKDNLELPLVHEHCQGRRTLGPDGPGCEK